MCVSSSVRCAFLCMRGAVHSDHRSPPPLVQSGHAASLTPYYSDTPRPPPRTGQYILITDPARRARARAGGPAGGRGCWRGGGSAGHWSRFQQGFSRGTPPPPCQEGLSCGVPAGRGFRRPDDARHGCVCQCGRPSAFPSGRCGSSAAGCSWLGWCWPSSAPAAGLRRPFRICPP